MRSSPTDPVPERLDEAARSAYTWRTIDAELAELMADSADALEEWGRRCVRDGSARGS